MEQQTKMHRKVILLGESTVGKSSIIGRRINNSFNQNIPNTIGTAFFKQKMNREGIQLEVSIWDTCGQEQFMAISTIYYRDAHIIVLALDATMPESLDSARVYMEEIEQNADEKCTVFLCINKIDLLGDRDYEGEKVAFSEVYSEQENQRSMQVVKDHCEFYDGIQIFYCFSFSVLSQFFRDSFFLF